jgi:hypothetical protein
MEMLEFQASDVHSYASKMKVLREDFEKLKTAKTEGEVASMLEKYEQFIEFTYQVTPYVRKFIFFNNPPPRVFKIYIYL